MVKIDIIIALVNRGLFTPLYPLINDHGNDNTGRMLIILTNQLIPNIAY